MRLAVRRPDGLALSSCRPPGCSRHGRHVQAQPHALGNRGTDTRRCPPFASCAAGLARGPEPVGGLAARWAAVAGRAPSTRVWGHLVATSSAARPPCHAGHATGSTERKRVRNTPANRGSQAPSRAPVQDRTDDRDLPARPGSLRSRRRRRRSSRTRSRTSNA